MSIMADQQTSSVPFEFNLNLPPTSSAVSLLSNPMSFSSTSDFSGVSSAMDVSSLTLDSDLREAEEDKKRRKENRRKHGRTSAKHSRQTPCNFRWQNHEVGNSGRLEAPCRSKPNLCRVHQDLGLCIPQRKRSNPNFMQRASLRNNQVMGLSIPRRKTSHPGLMSMVLEETAHDKDSNTTGLGGSDNSNYVSLGSVSHARRSPVPNPATMALETSSLPTPNQNATRRPKKAHRNSLNGFCVEEFLKIPMNFPAVQNDPVDRPENDDMAPPVTRFVRQESAASSAVMPSMPARKESLRSFSSSHGMSHSTSSHSMKLRER